MNELVGLLLRSETLSINPGVNQLEHALQTAALARRAGAASDLVFGALMHDVGRLSQPAAHGCASAELIAPFVSHETYWTVRMHDDIRLLELADANGPVSRAADYAGEPWFPLACRFAGEWDRYAFVPEAPVMPLPFYLPMLEELCNN
ncbi:HD domain-containing protein (plasmid) [Sphingobium sp. SJ10-10]|uniref:HD domain-containing protein n=1 Tax=Sphingobium sp. SJ10-10 TaxID=3114999 RepID=UPI002E19177F|nr:HD domain-containing protein [Sphingobium sp. SJ10-10]